MNYGFVKVAAAVPHIQVADCFYNIEKIEGLMRQASEKGVQIIAFPELSVTAYTCLDLFAQQTLLDGAETALLQLVSNTADLNILAIVGVPLRTGNQLINAAVVFQKGVIRGVVPKTYLPNYKEFQEQRWFTSATELRTSTISIGEKNTRWAATCCSVRDNSRLASRYAKTFGSPSPPVPCWQWKEPTSSSTSPPATN